MAVTPWGPGGATQLAQGWRCRDGLRVDSLGQTSPFLRAGSHGKARPWVVGIHAFPFAMKERAEYLE